MKHVVCNLSVLMAERKIKSVSEIQRMTGLPRKTLDKCFSNEARQISYGTAERLGEALNCKFDDLYKLVDEDRHNEIKEARNQHKNYLKHGVVYFIKNPTTNLVKIGKTSNIDSRLVTLSSEYGKQIELLKTIESDDSLKTEKAFHRIFSHKRVVGEWFDLSDEDIRGIKKEQKNSSVVNSN